MTLARLGEWFASSARLVRAMPNTPMQVGLGASVYAPGRTATEADLAQVERILAAAGKAWRVDESQIDTITALSGSGPAYVFHFLDALMRGASALGLDENLARELAVQTVLGSAALAAQSPLAPLELAAQVKSPRGTTLAGCAVLEENDAFNQLIARCLAARGRARRRFRGGRNRGGTVLRRLAAPVAKMGLIPERTQQAEWLSSASARALKSVILSKRPRHASKDF